MKARGYSEVAPWLLRQHMMREDVKLLTFLEPCLPEYHVYPPLRPSRGSPLWRGVRSSAGGVPTSPVAGSRIAKAIWGVSSRPKISQRPLRSNARTSTQRGRSGRRCARGWLDFIESCVFGFGGLKLIKDPLRSGCQFSSRERGHPCPPGFRYDGLRARMPAFRVEG